MDWNELDAKRRAIHPRQQKQPPRKEIGLRRTPGRIPWPYRFFVFFSQLDFSHYRTSSLKKGGGMSWCQCVCFYSTQELKREAQLWSKTCLLQYPVIAPNPRPFLWLVCWNSRWHHDLGLSWTTEMDNGKKIQQGPLNELHLFQVKFLFYTEHVNTEGRSERDGERIFFFFF